MERKLVGPVGWIVKLKIKKAGDGNDVMSFVRADGSTTSGRLGSGGFGAVHDLTHYVVESSLRLQNGFFGLLQQGWDMRDFEGKGTSARLSDEAIVAECIVGQLTNAVFGGPNPSATDFNWLIGEAVAGVRPGAIAPFVSPDALAQMQTQLADLLDQWRALAPGQTMELAAPLG
jgi:hypothetical protein